MAKVNEGPLERVRKLLAQSEDATVTAEEAESFQAAANRLMAKYAIDAAELYAAQTKEEREKPVAREIKLFEVAGYEFRNEYNQVLSWLKKVCRVEVVNMREIGVYYVAGFDADVRWFELLWTAIHLSWISKLNPSWKSGDENFDENVFNFVLAGYKWKEIATKAGVDFPDGGRLKRAYVRYCKAHEITPESHTQRHDAYRRAFARSFAQRISYRLMDMFTENEDSGKAAGAEVAIRDRHTDVLDMVYTTFPGLRPLTDEQLAEMQERDRAEQQRRQDEFDEWFAGLTEKQQREYLEREARQRAKQARQNEKYWDEFDRRNTDARGSSLGRQAADSVDLTAGRGNVGSAEREALS